MQNYAVAQVAATIVPGTTDIGNHCDDCVTTITLPFPFTFYDRIYTQVTLDSNGKAHFPTGVTEYSNVCLSASTFNNTIYPYWDDLMTTSTLTCTPGPCGIFTSVSGTAPDRIFNIEWRTQYYPGSGNANFELRLYEGAPSRFDVIFGNVTSGNTSATSGVRHDASFLTQYFCDASGGPATGAQRYSQPVVGGGSQGVRMPHEGELIPMEKGAVNPWWGMPEPPDPKNTSPMSRVGPMPHDRRTSPPPAPANSNFAGRPDDVTVGAGSTDFMWKITTPGQPQTGGTGQKFYDVPTARWYGPMYGQSGGTIAQAPAVLEYNGQFQVVALGTDGQIYQAWYNPPPDNRWYGWFRLSVPTQYNPGFTSAPAIASYSTSPGTPQFQVVARGSDGSLWQAFYNWADRWYGWTQMRDSANQVVYSAAAPALASFTGNSDRREFNVFYISNDANRTLLQLIFNVNGSGTWSGPNSLAGPWESAPAATQYQNQLHVWGAQGGRLRYHYFTPPNNWTYWASPPNIGVGVGSAPAIMQYLDQLQVFYIQGASTGAWNARQQFYHPPESRWVDGGLFSACMSSAPSLAPYGVGGGVPQFQVWWRHYSP